MRRFLGSAAGDTARRVLVLALTGALALVATLGVQSRGMRRSIMALERRAFLPYAGMVVPVVEVTSLTGETVTIGDPAVEKRQVLLFFTTTCGYCRETLSAWQQIADSLGVLGHEAIGVSLDSLRPTIDYVREHALTVPVVELADRRMRALYRAKGVPITLVVAEGGRVLHARMGALTTPNAVDSVLSASERKFACHVTRR
jgi:peroxiredoxin